MNDAAYDPLLLDHQLCFALYAASKEVIRLYTPYLSPHGLTYTQYIALLVLWEADDITVSELGARLMLDSGTLAPMLKKLAEKGYLLRTRSTEDERVVKLKLTPSGRELKDAFKGLPQKLACELALPVERLAVLKAELHALTQQLHEQQHSSR